MRIDAPLPPELTTSNQLLITSGATSAATAWLKALPWAERFMAQLTLVTGGAAASVSLDGSNDGSTSAGQIGLWSLDTLNQQVISPPIKSPYPFIKITITSAGSGTVSVGRGA